MKIFSNLLICEIKYLYCLSLLQLVSCLYEGQADKFDSKQQYIGKVKFAYIDPLTAGTDRFVVATDKNEVVCLSTENGNVIWGQNLQKEKLGEIDALSEEGDLVTVNGGGQFVGSWDLTTGKLLWEIEIAFPHPQNSAVVSYFKINTLLKEIIKIEILPKKHAKVYIYDYARALLKTSDIIDVSLWFNKDTKCNFFSSNYFICAEPDRKVLRLLSVKETSGFKPVHLSSMVGGNYISDLDVKNTQLISVPYQDSMESPMVIFQSGNSTFFININPPELRMSITNPFYDSVTSARIGNYFSLFVFYRTDDRSNENSIYKFGALFSMGYGEAHRLEGGTFSLREHRGALIKTFILPYIKKDHGISYKLLLQFEDNSVLLYHQQGQLIWSREDAMSRASSLIKNSSDKFNSKQYIGKVKFAYIDPLIAGTDKFVVATDKNEVVCLSTENGNVIWGHNLQKEKLGAIDALSEDGDLITVNGGGQFVESWDLTTGKLLWENEITFPHPQNSGAVSYFKINTLSKEIIKIEILPKKHAKVYIYDYARASLKTSDIIDVSLWFDKDTKCNFFSSNYFICAEPDRKVLRLLSVKEMSVFKPVHLSSMVGGNYISDLDVKNTQLISVPYLDSRENPIVIFQLDNSSIFLGINPLNLKMISKSHSFVKYTSTWIDKKNFILFSVSYTDDRGNGNNIYEAQARIAEGYGKHEDIVELKGKYSVPEHRGELMKAFILPYIKKDRGISYKLLLLCEDNSVLLYHQQGQLIWSREGAMSRASSLIKNSSDKFDSKQYIGKVKFAYIDPLIAETDKFVMATEENEVVCLSTENGNVIWGQNLQKEKLGEIDALSEKGDLITVNGGGQFVGSWDLTTGELLWEKEITFPHPQNSAAVSYFKINTLSKEIIKIEILPKKHAKVYIYDYARASLKTSDIIDVSLWFDKDTKCNFFSSNYFICAEPDRKVLRLLSVKETSGFKPVDLSGMVGGNYISDLDVKNSKLISVPYLDARKNPIAIFQLDNSSIFLDINPPELKMISKPHSSVKYTSALIDNNFFILFSVSYTDGRYNGNNIYEADARISQGYYPNAVDIIGGLKGKYSVPEHRGALMKAFILPYIKKDRGISYKLLLQFEDNSLLLYHQQGQLIWSREEVQSKDPLKVHRAWSDEL